jgi:hypothetical protein
MFLYLYIFISSNILINLFVFWIIFESVRLYIMTFLNVNKINLLKLKKKKNMQATKLF